MSNFDEQITALQAEAEEVRTTLPPLADEFYAGAGAWASAQWEAMIASAIEADPDAVSQNRNQLSALKKQLLALQDSAAEQAQAAYAGWMIGERFSDEKLLALASAPRTSFDTHVRVSLPRSKGRDEAPDRALLSKIGPAIVDAGLKVPGMSNGRWTSSIPWTNYPLDQLNAYETAVKELIVALYKAEEIRTAKARAEAAALWDEA